MNELVVPGIVLALSLAAASLLCLRPMVRGQHGGLARNTRATASPSSDPEELGRLRGEFEELRAELVAHRRAAID
ncbi:hypothetical protein [Nocardioides perillae]|uniref:Phage shock protein B n=1 Tax=Nocardioides perillae TaxID=1119534 RepID=A0A7Y9UKF5_9ACTN|nr:hypothetical protein [Nocardioides perillae]NYG55333.1 hypothetical protein [Nocardioides perillae]